MTERQETRWNGEPCQARRVTAIVADDGVFPQYWARHLVGTRRNVVEVTHGDHAFYIDNEDGSGWNKVTHGGSPHWAHSNLTIEPDSVQPRIDEPEKDGLRAQIAEAIGRTDLPFWSAKRRFAAADAVLDLILPATRNTAGLARDSEAAVQRVITLYERWVKAGPPPLGASMSRWWDRRLAELHAAVLHVGRPAEEQPAEVDLLSPTWPDGNYEATPAALDEPKEH